MKDAMGRENFCISCQLTLVEQDHDFVEAVHEVHVVIAVFLNLQDETQFGAIVGGESLEKLRVDLEMTEGLVGDQLFLLVPLAQRHDRRPDNANDFMFWNDILFGQILNISNYFLLRLVVLNIIDNCLKRGKKRMLSIKGSLTLQMTTSNDLSTMSLSTFNCVRAVEGCGHNKNVYSDCCSSPWNP